MANPSEVRPDTPFDLTILYMSDARSWCEYLFDIFQPYEVYQNSEEITTFPTHETTLNNIKESRVVIVIVSPVFIDNCSPMLEQYTEQVVALLCGVTVEDLSAIQPSVPSYKNWKIVEALSGQRNITQVTLKLLDGMDSDAEEGEEENYLTMHGNVAEQEPEDTYLTMHGNVANSKDSDDTYLTMHGNIEVPAGDYISMKRGADQVPEEVYESMTGIVQEDTYETMTGTGKGPRMPPRQRGHEFAPSKQGYINAPAEKQQQYSEGINISPTTLRSGSKEPLFIIFPNLIVSTRPEDMYKALFTSSSMTSNVVAIVVNQCTLRINRLPEGHVKVEILHNNNSIATLPLKVVSPVDVISEQLMTITNPFHFMCEALGISPADSNKLDNVLFEHCQRHLPADGFEKFLGTTQKTQEEMTSIKEVPTLLHFAAKYGLKNMCSMLVNCPGAYQAMNTKNCNGDTPSELAAKSGDESLKDFLENYVDMAENEVLHNPEGIYSSRYVHMTGDVTNVNPQYINKVGKKSDYDRPFPVAIPAATSLIRDDTIKSLVSGNEDDIYDFYDNSSWGKFHRHDDDDDDDDEAGEDYEHVEDHQDQPPSTRPPDPTRPPETEEVIGNVRITPVAELDRTPRTINPGARVPQEQQALIDLQNKVKSSEISMEEAVAKFKELELGMRREQLSFKNQSAVLKDKKTRFGFFTKKRDVFYSFSEILRDKRGQSTFYTGSQETNGVAARAAGNVNTPTRKLRTRSDPVAVGRDTQWLPSIPERFANDKTQPPLSPKQSPLSPKSPSFSKSGPPPTTPKPNKPGSPGALSKGGPTAPVSSPKQGRVAEKIMENQRPISTASTSTSPTRTFSPANPLASLATASSSCTLPILSSEDTKQCAAGSGSRASVLSTGSRDSSYGSAAEVEPEPEAEPSPPPTVPRRAGEHRKTSKSKRFSARFEHEYIDKPLPPIPSRAKAPEPELPRTIPEDIPYRQAPPPPRDSTRRSSDPPSSPPQPGIPVKPKPQPRPRRPTPQQ